MMTFSLADVLNSLDSLERILVPLACLLIGAELTRRFQFDHWVRDKKLREYVELIDAMLDAKWVMLETRAMRAGGVAVISHDEQEDAFRKQVALGKAFQNRLFIDKTLRKLRILEKWNEIERLAADDASTYVDFGAKLNDLIEAVRKSARQVTS